MSAIMWFGGEAGDLVFPSDYPGGDRFHDLVADCYKHGDLFYFKGSLYGWNNEVVDEDPWFGFAFDGQIPESLIANYPGRTPRAARGWLHSRRETRRVRLDGTERDQVDRQPHGLRPGLARACRNGVMSIITANPTSGFLKSEITIVGVPQGFSANYPQRQFVTAKMFGGLAFFNDHTFHGTVAGIAFEGRVPEMCIDNYVGCHPEHLIEGFTAMDKPEGCQWMCRSRIKSICNHQGSVLVLLEPAS